LCKMIIFIFNSKKYAVKLKLFLYENYGGHAVTATISNETQPSLKWLKLASNGPQTSLKWASNRPQLNINWWILMLSVHDVCWVESFFVKINQKHWTTSCSHGLSLADLQFVQNTDCGSSTARSGLHSWNKLNCVVSGK
jgi:hypothetical protein